MLQEYDVVILRRQVSSIPVPPGTTGAVLVVYDSDPVAYEVEFIDKAGNSFGSYTVPEADLELVEPSRGPVSEATS